jgi:hypothetical protein
MQLSLLPALLGVSFSPEDASLKRQLTSTEL